MRQWVRPTMRDLHQPRWYDPVMPMPSADRCLTDEELNALRQAFERYGSGDGFWMAFTEIMEQAVTRLGCDRQIVIDEMRAAFHRWSSNDPQFL